MWQHSAGDVIMMTSLQLSVSTFQSEIALHQAGALQLVTCDPCEAPTRHGTDWDNCFLFIRYMIRAGCCNLPRELSLTASSQSARDKFPENFSATLPTSPHLVPTPKMSKTQPGEEVSHPWNYRGNSVHSTNHNYCGFMFYEFISPEPKTILLQFLYQTQI